MKYLNFKNINYYFSNYKKRATHHNLSNLYNELDPLIVDVCKNISKSFRSKNPEDFEDLLQQVRLEIFNILDRICQISFSGEQLAKILVRVIQYSFIDSYKKYKKEKFIVSHIADVHDEKIAYPMVNIHDFLGQETRSDWENGADSYKKVYKASIYTNSSQEEVYYLNSLNNKILEKVKTLNRYKEQEEIVLFCVNSYFNSRNIYPKIIQQMWKVDNPEFWLKYSEILLKIAVYDEFESGKTYLNKFSR